MIKDALEWIYCFIGITFLILWHTGALFLGAVIGIAYLMTNVF
jgi:hypothetical protein